MLFGIMKSIQLTFVTKIKSCCIFILCQLKLLFLKRWGEGLSRPSALLPATNPWRFSCCKLSLFTQLFIIPSLHQSQLVNHTCVIIWTCDQHPQSIRAAITKYHRLGWFINNRDLFHIVLEAGKSKIKVLAGSVSATHHQHLCFLNFPNFTHVPPSLSLAIILIYLFCFLLFFKITFIKYNYFKSKCIPQL